MSDLDSKTINAILRLPKEKIFSFLNSSCLTEDLFFTCKSEFIYLRDYIAKNGQTPSKSLFKRRFPEFNCEKGKDPFPVLTQEMMERAQRNTLVKLVNKIGSEDTLHESLDECIKDVSNAVIEVQKYDPKSSDHEYTTGVSERLQKYEDRKANLTGMTFTTGCSRMDSYLSGGIMAPQMAVLAGDPKTGKTWWLVNMVCKVYQQGKVPLVVTPELDYSEIERRIDSMRFELPFDALRMGKLTKKQEARWKARSKQDTLPLHIVDTTEAAFTPSFLRTKIELYRPDIVFVDSAYMMTPDGESTGSYQDNHKLVKQLKGLLKDCRIPGVFVVQMKREAEIEKDQGESALRRIYGGDHWAQIADVMLRLTGSRSDKFRKLVLLANREGCSFMDDLISYSFDPSPSIASVENYDANEGELEEGDEYVNLEI